MVSDAILDDEFNAWITIDEQGWNKALAAHFFRAAAGTLRGPLDGVSLAVKDNIDVAGLRTTHGSGAFADAEPAETDAPLVARLRQAGMAIVGKTHMTELACGTAGRNVHFGDALNPHDKQRHPGGSSSGSAIAVALGHVALAVGSDTGGSIRIPAAACGVVGLKPTFGRVSTEGMSVCARALDHAGPLAATVELAALGLDAMQNEGWPSIRPRSHTVAGMRVGILAGDFVDACDSSVQLAFESTIAALQRVGCQTTDVDLGLDLEEVTERANALSRDLLDWFGPAIERSETSGDPEVGEWLELYRQVSDDRYAEGLTEQDRVRTIVADAQQDIDVLLCPTMRTPPCAIDDAPDQPRDLRAGNLDLSDMTGQPSLTVPHGQADGLPLGVLLTGRFGEDQVVLDLGAALEATTLSS